MKYILTIVFVMVLSNLSLAKEVFSVKYENQADLKVYKVKYENQITTNEGLWFFEKYENLATKYICFVNYENQSDLKIYFVKYQNQAGWKNNSKKQLLY